jgi:hypothetical protein
MVMKDADPKTAIQSCLDGGYSDAGEFIEHLREAGFEIKAKAGESEDKPAEKPSGFVPFGKKDDDEEVSFVSLRERGAKNADSIMQKRGQS